MGGHLQGKLATLGQFEMDASAESPSKHQSGQAKFASMLAGGRSLDPADFGDFVQRNWPTVLEYPQDM